MGNVAVIFKIMPEDADSDIDQLREQIQSQVTVSDMQEEPVAFGLKALKVSVIVPDAEGYMDELEETIGNITGVGSVEIEDTTLV